MELHIQSDFDCVYLINGELSDRADSLTMSEYDVVYVTVFPIDIRLLPYTVKLEGADNIKNSLAVGVRLSAEHYLLHLAPRALRQRRFFPQYTHAEPNRQTVFARQKRRHDGGFRHAHREPQVEHKRKRARSLLFGLRARRGMYLVGRQ